MHSDDTIFHYTSMSIAIEHILSYKRLRFSKSTKTNDPREYSYRYFTAERDYSHRMSDGKLAINAAVINRIREAETNLNKIIQHNYKLACFCSNRRSQICNDRQDDRYGYDRLRMWSQYGENHYGVCITFSATALTRQLREQVGESVFIHADHVEYKDDLHIEGHKTQRLEERVLHGNGANRETFAQEKVKELFFVKHRDYADENEYRIVMRDSQEGAEYFYLDISKSIRGVILGDRFEEVYKSIIDEYCRELNVESRRVVWMFNKLRLTETNHTSLENV